MDIKCEVIPSECCEYECSMNLQNVKKDDTIKRVKEIIHSILAIPENQQQLMYEGKKMEDDKKLLAYGVSLGSTIQLKISKPIAKSNKDTEDEIAAFQKNFCMLAKGIREPAMFAARLYSEELITSEELDTAVHESQKPCLRILQLIRAVERQINLFPKENFRRFIQVLCEEPCYQPLAKSLNLQLAEKIISDQQSSKRKTNSPTTDLNVEAKESPTQSQSYVVLTTDEIQQQVKSFENRFEELSYELQEELEEKIEEGKEKLRKVKHAINLLPHEIKSEHDRFLNSIAIEKKVLKDIKDVEDVFNILNRYWNCFNYSLLQHLINRFASNELKVNMHQYDEDMKTFRERTPVNAFVEVWRADDDLPPEAERQFIKVRAVLSKDPSQCTLEELHQLRKDYCSAYHLPQCALMLCSVNVGSIIVEWRLAIQLARKLMSTIKRVPVEVFCITRKITLMYVGRHKVYDDIVFEETEVEGQESLCDLLDRRGSECLNEKNEHPYTDALLPGPLQYLESDVDEQLIISLRFKTTVRLHSLQLTGPLNGRAPKTVRLFVNQPEPLCFESAQNRVALQEFVLTDENVRDDAVMTLNYLKFQNVMSLTIFVEDNQGNKETTVIHHIGLFGSPVEYLNMAHFRRVSGVEGERHIHEWEYSSCGRNP